MTPRVGESGRERWNRGPQAKALSVELGTQITPGFEALVFKASRGVEDIYELTYIRKDGSQLPAVVSVTALRDVDDAIIGYGILAAGCDGCIAKPLDYKDFLAVVAPSLAKLSR